MSFRLKATFAVQVLVLSPFLFTPLSGQNWDPGTLLTKAISEGTNEKLRFTIEQRGRYEDRTGNTFGKDVDMFTGLNRRQVSFGAFPFYGGATTAGCLVVDRWPVFR